MKIYPQFCSTLSVVLESKGKVLQRTLRVRAAKVDQADPRSLPPTVASGGLLWAEHKDVQAHRHLCTQGFVKAAAYRFPKERLASGPLCLKATLGPILH